MIFSLTVGADTSPYSFVYWVLVISPLSVR